MSETFRCDDKDTLMGFIYDEIDPIIRRRVEEHLRTCAACASEVAALADVRVDLAAWTPPQLELDFAIINKGSKPAVAKPASWWYGVPVWAQAAAAVLVIAAGAGIANLHVKSGPEGFVVTTGWMTPAPAPAGFANVSDPSADWKPALTALATQLRSEMHSAPGAGQPAAMQTAARPAADMRAVQLLIEASEARQRQELALRLTQFNRDVNVQRSADLVKIDQMFGQLDGRTGAMDARQRQLMNYIQRVSNPQQ